MAELVFATVHKIGSSIGVVIPSAYCKALGIKRGDQMLVSSPTGHGVWFHKMTKLKKEKIIKW